MNGRGCVVTTLGLVLLLPASLVNGDGAHANGTERRGPKTTTVVVTMRDQSALEGRHIKNRKARQRAVITDLLATATAGQASLRRDLDRWRRLGTVVDYEPLWVVDAVTVTATVEVVAAIAARPDVAEVAPDAIEIVPSLAPGTINQATIGAPEVWALGSSGQGVVVATLDSGADLSHPDLESRWRGGSNSWFDPYGQHPSSPVDLSGHGTATLGVLVGGDVSGSTLGTAPGAKWVSARIWDDAGRSTTSAIHRAFQWLLDPDGDPRTNDAPRVVNGSWSVGSTPGCDEVFRPDVQALVAAGISPVFAAGNFGTAAGSGASPANYPESIAVGAVRTDGLSVLPSSSRGPTSCGGPERVFPDVVAPGESIVTTERFGQYQSVSGTSVAAPHVAGTLALMVAAHPSLTPAQQRASVLTSALDLGATGPDDTFGLGRVSASAAYAASAAPPDLVLSVAPPVVSANPGDRVVFDVTTQAQNGFEGAVQLSAESHGGLELDLSPDSFGQGSGQATLTVSVPTGATSGDHRITVVASSAGQTWSSTATVAVEGVDADVVRFSTVGNRRPPGVPGTPDDADILRWRSGGGVTEWLDLSAPPFALPARADVDGFSQGRGRRFFVSFAHSIRVPGLGRVHDEDVVRFDGTRWRLWFDGSRHGLGARTGIDAVSVSRGRLFFSTDRRAKPPGVGGSGDDADIYRWQGRRFSRVWDASRHGLPRRADIDGLHVAGTNRLAMSFRSARTRISGFAGVGDEDIVGFHGGQWTLVFDGGGHGLRGPGRDIDAFDLR